MFPATRSARVFSSLITFGVLLLSAAASLWAGDLRLVLPTDNEAIYSDDPSAFYMYTDRNFEGVRSKPWNGGCYGFARNPKRFGGNILMTRFHEGIDIKPVRRDSAGEPLDDVRSISDGKVVHTSPNSSHSNYGRYVVVRHDWDAGPFYSLYAHLNTIFVKPGQSVSAGTPLGRLGYTGAGINRERAHVHVELNMMLSKGFERWHDRHYTTPNHHGIYNGLNLVGVDVAAVFHTLKAQPHTTMPDFIRYTAPYYKVMVPKSSKLDILDLYPWLKTGSGLGAHSWEIAFSNVGIPLSASPSDKDVSNPYVSWVRNSSINHSYLTAGRITGVGESASLTSSGSRFIQLIAGTF